MLTRYRRLLPYLVAQSKLETDNYTSRVYQVDNNLFGMKVNSRPFETPGLMSPEGNRYAHYERDFDSVRDMVGWLEQTNFPAVVDDAGNYARELKTRGFYGPAAEQYALNLNYWLYGTK